MHQQAASRRAPLPRWARLALGAAAVAAIALAIQYRHNTSTPDYLQACLNGEAQKRAVLYETTLEDRKRGGRTLQTHWLRNCGLHLQKKTMQLDATIANGIGYVQVDTSKKYQTIEGFGGAFTEASAKTWMRLPFMNVNESLTCTSVRMARATRWESPHEFLRLLCRIVRFRSRG